MPPGGLIENVDINVPIDGLTGNVDSVLLLAPTECGWIELDTIGSVVMWSISP
jgi:hypothetical protein